MNPLATALVVVLLVSGMVAMGTATNIRELRASLRTPGPLVLALAINLVAIPAATFVALRLLDLDPTASITMMVVAASPGGGTGALLSLHVRGDQAHAVALQVVLALASLAAAPAWLAAYAGADDVHIDVVPLVVALAVLQWTPLALALTASSRRPGWAATFHPHARRVADLTLAALIVVLLITSGSKIDHNSTDTVTAIGLVLGLTVLGGLLAIGPPAVRRASAMTTLVRNLSIGLAAVTFLDDADEAALVVLTYGLAMYLSAITWVLVRRARTTG